MRHTYSYLTSSSFIVNRLTIISLFLDLKPRLLLLRFFSNLWVVKKMLALPSIGKDVELLKLLYITNGTTIKWVPPLQNTG